MVPRFGLEWVDATVAYNHTVIFSSRYFGAVRHGQDYIFQHTYIVKGASKDVFKVLSGFGFGFVRLHGVTVGVKANRLMMASTAWNAKHKAAKFGRFIRTGE